MSSIKLFLNKYFKGYHFNTNINVTIFTFYLNMTYYISNIEKASTPILNILSLKYLRL